MIYKTGPGRKIKTIFIALAGLLDSLISICSLGFYGSTFCFKVAAYLELKELERKRNVKH